MFVVKLGRLTNKGTNRLGTSKLNGALQYRSIAIVDIPLGRHCTHPLIVTTSLDTRPRGLRALITRMREQWRPGALFPYLMRLDTRLVFRGLHWSILSHARCLSGVYLWLGNLSLLGT